MLSLYVYAFFDDVEVKEKLLNKSNNWNGLSLIIQEFWRSATSNSKLHNRRYKEMQRELRFKLSNKREVRENYNKILRERSLSERT